MQGRLTIKSALGVAVAGICVWTVLQVRTKSQPSAPPTAFHGAAVTLITPQQGPINLYSEITGSAEPASAANISAEATGRVLSRQFDRGDRLQAGAPLVVIDSQSAEADLARARAAQNQAASGRMQAEAELARADVETSAATEQADAQLKQALAEEARATAMLDAARAGQHKAETYTRQQELKQAQDALSQAVTSENLAKIDLSRARELVAEGAEARQSLDRANAAYDTAVARRRSAESAVSLAKEGARSEDRQAASAQTDAAKAALAASAGQIASAKAGVKSASTRELRLSGIRRQIDALKAQEQQAQEAVRLAQIQLDHHIVRAPFAGSVLQRSAEQGDLLAPGSPVARIANIRNIKVVFSVPELLSSQVRAGQRQTIVFDALPGKQFSGTVVINGLQADPRTRAFQVEIQVPNPTESILPGMVGHLRIPAAQARTGLLLPPSAIMGEAGHLCVFTIENGHAIRRAITTGETVGNLVEIATGLPPGIPVAATPQLLSDGAEVTVNAGGKP